MTLSFCFCFFSASSVESVAVRVRIMSGVLRDRSLFFLSVFARKPMTRQECIARAHQPLCECEEQYTPRHAVLWPPSLLFACTCALARVEIYCILDLSATVPPHRCPSQNGSDGDASCMGWDGDTSEDNSDDEYSGDEVRPSSCEGGGGGGRKGGGRGGGGGMLVMPPPLYY